MEFEICMAARAKRENGYFYGTVKDPLTAIRKVIFNDPATIVIWEDRTKTVVKAHDEPFDPEKGLAMAIAKKAMGNTSRYHKIFRKFLPPRHFELYADGQLMMKLDELEN